MVATRLVVRRLEPWSILKMSLLFYTGMWLAFLTALFVLWMGAASVGVVRNIEDFFDSVGFTDFRFEPARLLVGSVLFALVVVVVGTVANVIGAMLYNLIAEVLGGIRIVVSDDDTGRRRV